MSEIIARLVWKFSLALRDGEQQLCIPSPGRILHVGSQGDKICLWVEVNPRKDLFYRQFVVYGTGHPIAGGDYVGTCFIGGLVWHVYELQTGVP